MMRSKRAVILHGYSSANKGDGLLVDRAVGIARGALGDDVELTLVANHPESFDYLGITVIDSGPRRSGFSRRYVELMRSLDDFDLVLGVGGAYLRFGTFDAALKASIIHLPQLYAASRTRAPVIYLPQSVGPLRGPFRPVLRRLLSRIDSVWLRDDRSVAELSLPNSRRSMDLALHDIPLTRGAGMTFDVSAHPVLSVRHVDGGLPAPLLRLTEALRPYDGYVQSVAGANDDRAATELTDPKCVLSTDQLILDPSARRVVIAVRMHAALMALAAGHYVIHLAYERKGFAAFADLGLAAYVHNVRRFDPDAVSAQVDALYSSPAARSDYDELVRSTQRSRDLALDSLLEDVRMRADGSARASGGSLPSTIDQGALE